MPLNVTLRTLSNFNKEQMEKIIKCSELIYKAVNSEEFKNQILAFNYTPMVTKGSLWWKTTVLGENVKFFYFHNKHDQITNEEVYKKIMSGWEESSPEEDQEIDLYLSCKYSRWSKATAYGYPNNDEITIYSWWIDQASLAELSNTIFHEWLHNCGFEHDFKWTPLRQYSVPYAAGKILENIIIQKLPYHKQGTVDER